MKITAAKLSEERKDWQGKPYHELTLYHETGDMGLWALDTMRVSSKPYELLDGFTFKGYVKPTETDGFWVYSDIPSSKLYNAMVTAAKPIATAFLTDLYIHDRYNANQETANPDPKPFVYVVCEAGTRWVYSRETLGYLRELHNPNYNHWFVWNWETETLSEVSFGEALQTLPAA